MKPISIYRLSPSEGAGYLIQFLTARQIPWQLICIDAGEAVPHNASPFSGLVFMGGPMSVNDQLPWIDPVLSLIRDAVSRDIPVLGHCLGGQLMSRALGGRVTKNEVKEIGWGEVTTSDNAEALAWFGEVKSTVVFHWHGETFSLPEGATHMISSKYCMNQGYALGKHLALQCHVEMTEVMIREWCKIGAGEISQNQKSPGVQSVTTILSQMPQYLLSMQSLADKLYTKWLAGLHSV